VDDVAAFESRAIELARDPARRLRVRQRLAQARDTAALFDTPAYCLALERAFESMLAA
jgi:predicted O-linked N-acetylglucosamine transferase (SPINDLY family)